MVNEKTILWGGFTLFILAMLALDLGVFHRKAHVIFAEEALNRFQRSYENLAIVVNSNDQWTGILGIEDVLEEIGKPILAFARSGGGIPLEESKKRADLIFLLLTPRGMARMQPYLLSDIIGLKDSDYVMERLRKTNSPDEVIEVIRSGQQVILD